LVSNKYIKLPLGIPFKIRKTKNEFEKIVTLSKEQEKIMKAVDKNILKLNV